MNAREALNSLVEALEQTGFVIIPRSEVEAKDKEISELREALENLLARPAGQAVTEAMVEAAQRIRDVAMRQTIAARVPECGEFGAIAQDADWLVDALKAAMEA